MVTKVLFHFISFHVWRENNDKSFFFCRAQIEIFIFFYCFHMFLRKKFNFFPATQRLRIIYILRNIYTVRKVIDFPRYNTKCIGDNEILRGIFHVVYCFPLHFVLYISRKFWLLFGQCTYIVQFLSCSLCYHRKPLSCLPHGTWSTQQDILQDKVII